MIRMDMKMGRRERRSKLTSVTAPLEWREDNELTDVDARKSEFLRNGHAIPRMISYLRRNRVFSGK